MEKSWKLKSYKASLKLKENFIPLLSWDSKITNIFVAIISGKTTKINRTGPSWTCPPADSEWASPIVVLRKSDGDIRICRDYKISVNHKVCSDSYPIPNVEVTIHAVAGMSIFKRINLKSAYDQIPTDDKFEEDQTMINTPMGLLKWKRMSCGLKTASAIFQRTIEQVLGEDIKKYALLPRQYMHRNY